MNYNKFKLELGKRVAISEPNGDTRSLWKHEGDKIIEVLKEFLSECDVCNGNGKIVGTTLDGHSTLDDCYKCKK